MFSYKKQPEGFAKTVAHELGHGLFRLFHTFSTENKYKISEPTDNLMLNESGCLRVKAKQTPMDELVPISSGDYNGGTALYKYQWDLIHDPEKIWFTWLEEEGEGEMSIVEDKDIEWVVELYSPQISEKFLEARKNNNIAEMRRLLEWSLQHSFTDDWLDKVKIGFTLENDRAVATLKHNQNPKYKGLRVYYTKKVYGDGGGLIGVFASDSPLYFAPAEGSDYAKNFPLDVKPYANQTNRVNIAIKTPEVIIDNNIKKELEDGLISSWLWKSGWVDPFAAGIVDGCWETIKSVWGLVKFASAWDITNIYYFSKEAEDTREQTKAFVAFINDLATSSESRQEFKNLVKNEFNDYINEIAGFTPEAQYLQGKLLFDIATLFIGVGEVKALLKGEKITISLIKTLKAIPKDLVRIITRAKNAGLVIQKTGDDIIKVLTKEGAEVALNDKENKLAIGFKEGKKVQAEIVDELRRLERNLEPNEFYASSKVGTMVEDVVLRASEKKIVYCVVDKNLDYPGRFLTTTDYGTDVATAVKELGILDEFKYPAKVPDGLEIRKYEVVKDLPTRKSIVGEIRSHTNPSNYQPGGGIQYEVHYIGDWTEGWSLYLKKIE